MRFALPVMSLAISADSAETSRALRDELGVTCALLGDADLAVTRAYYVEEIGKEIALPATFVIDRDGRIRFAYVGRRASDRPGEDDVIGALP